MLLIHSRLSLYQNKLVLRGALGRLNGIGLLSADLVSLLQKNFEKVNSSTLHRRESGVLALIIFA